MKVLDWNDTISFDGASIVTVGNFDGIHKGHQYLINEVNERTRNLGGKSVLITFDPHTRQVIYPDLSIQLLTTFPEKTHLVEMGGIDYLLRIPFTKEFSQHSSEFFIERILSKQLHTVEWVMGEGHRVGGDHQDKKNFLHTLLSKYHIIPFTADLLVYSKTVVSSTQIRVSIVHGRISEAVRMLGHPYLICSERTTGLKIGSQIGFPTLNFLRPPSQKVLPPPGVYAAELEYNRCVWQGALYFGKCPSFSNRETHFEFHAFHDDNRFPKIGDEGKLWVHSYIREDISFPSKRELANQIEIDVKMIKHFFIEEKRHAINQRT